MLLQCESETSLCKVTNINRHLEYADNDWANVCIVEKKNDKKREKMKKLIKESYIVIYKQKQFEKEHTYKKIKAKTDSTRKFN